MTQGFLHGVLHALVQLAVGPESALKVLDGLLSGVETKTVEVNAELYALSQLVHADAALKQLLATADSKQLIADRKLDAFPKFAARWPRFSNITGIASCTSTITCRRGSIVRGSCSICSRRFRPMRRARPIWQTTAGGATRRRS